MTKAKMIELLIEIYNEEGPREGRGTVVPPAEYAAMDTLTIERMWDFDRRHLMHRIAKAISHQ
jgi:hypothetical protein